MLLVFSLILALKNQFTNNLVNIKNRTCYFCSDTIGLKDFEPNLLKIDKKSYKNIDIYYIGYITIKKIGDYESIYSVNPFYLRINHASGCIDKKCGNKYLILDSVDENKEVLKKIRQHLRWN